MTSTPTQDTNQMGKRYECRHCGVSVICVRAGSGRLVCHDEPMTLLTTKPLPSSD